MKQIKLFEDFQSDKITKNTAILFVKYLSSENLVYDRETGKMIEKDKDGKVIRTLTTDAAWTMFDK